MSSAAQAKQALASALKRKQRLRIESCFDGLKPTSKPTDKQLEILKDKIHRILYVVAGNQSGKSTLGGRMTSWIFEENHPYWKRPTAEECHHCGSKNFEPVITDTGSEEEYRCHDCSKIWVSWGDEPLTLIVSGKVSKQVTELWEKKIEPFLKKDSYKVTKDGNALASVRNLKNGNKIIFLSHDKAIVSKEKIQSYVAHFVWIDEMPDHYLYIEEATQRVTSKLGILLCTFTPKTSNPEIKDMVESVDPSIGKKYQFGKLDNPINQSPEKREIVLAEAASLPETVRNAVLYGDWMDSDERVFPFDKHRHVRPRPEGYSLNSEHVVSYDPAASGKGGLVGAVRVPWGWHVMKADYTTGGEAYSDLVEDIDKKIKNLNVVRKIYDTHETAFILEFNKLAKEPNRLHNTDPWAGIKKHGRKKELITNLQQALIDGWLTFDGGLQDLFNEFTRAQWQDEALGKIKGSQRLHLLDALQYLIDLLPAETHEDRPQTRDQYLMQEMRKKLTAAPVQQKGNPRIQRRGRRGHRR